MYHHPTHRRSEREEGGAQETLERTQVNLVLGLRVLALGMSGRGRGAFSRGRGRGRGGGGRAGPIIRDETGGILTARKLEGPPPLFPAVETLPERPDITQGNNAFLVERRRTLHTFWNESAYYIEAVDKDTSSVPSDVERCLSRSKPGPQTKRKSLSLYLQLSSMFFPAELLGNQRKKRRENDEEGIWNLKGSSKSDLGRLDKLASLEQKVGQKGDKEAGENKEGEGAEENEEDQDIAFDDEDEFEDDYGKNEEFDDDEEYDFDDGGGDDEGPTY
ncbi:DNA-directed RNA polymerase III subunit rpc31 [Selaginella moellendorffii]|uniref:DNA-directed RNA polymerase III subunit rpc31 n=1 Tax=Selaginella moellendorffii TaxID=88036 RepID=UPI000D1C73DE|nr:DNA-directed RNA polymerase III subunit rpc31 [Selaginella moellendorffii]|eukprot:XP_002966000.2 DNA-directed RNA polymerase III subunit rpc31 [Selaginella moellendorffii]